MYNERITGTITFWKQETIMKLADVTVENHSAGVQNTNGFTIAQTSKMFKILSDSLYSDKIMAIIRELSTNANDAHIASGNANPFEVSLPCNGDPNFTIRDYGTGLSQEDMESLYTTYGASNKNDSNDFTGCLGLGSKSPFAYTKSFSTASYFNGKCYTYVAAMDEAGVPSLSLFGVTETDKPNGIEISFAVKQCDWDEFTEKAKRVYHYFKNHPVVKGGVCQELNNNTYHHEETVISGEGWRVGRLHEDYSKFPSHGNSTGAGMVAIMGNIAYPVSPEQVIGKGNEIDNDAIRAWNRAFGKADIDNWKRLVTEVLGAGLYLEIEFNIGDLEMDVSREGLQYTKSTVQKLREKTQEVYISLKQNMTDKLSESDCLIDAYRTFYNMSDVAGGYSAGAAWEDKYGTTHELSQGEDIRVKVPAQSSLWVMNYKTATYRSKRYVYQTDCIHYETLKGKTDSWHDNQRKEKLVLFQCDVKSVDRAKKIVLEWCTVNRSQAYLMINSVRPHEKSAEGYDDLINLFGGKVLKVSDYKDLINLGRSGGGPRGQISKNDIFVVHKTGGHSDLEHLGGQRNLNDTRYLREMNEELMEHIQTTDKKIVYIPMSRYAASSGPSIYRISRLAINNDVPFGEALLKKHTVFAIKNSSVARLKKAGYKLVSFSEWFKPKAEGLYLKTIKQTALAKTMYNYGVEQINKEEDTKQNRYNRCSKIEESCVAHLINIYGIDYAKNIKDKKVVDTISDYLILLTLKNLTQEKLCSNFKNQQIVDAVNYRMVERGIPEFDVTVLSTVRKKLNQACEMETHLRRAGINDIIDCSKVEKDAANQQVEGLCDLPSIDNIRKSFKEILDNNPMLKYTIGIGDQSLNASDAKPDEPVMQMAQNQRYNSTKHYDSVDRESIRNCFGL